MKIAILGYSSQGQSAYNYWNTPENELTVHDSRSDLELPDGVQAVLGDNYLDGLDIYDLVVRGAPTIHPRNIVAANSEAILSKVTSNTNEFFRVCPSQNIIGVTGTKGKGTTSTLIAKMLEASGKTVHLGGNIGIPPLDMLQAGIQADDWVVLELANYQLIDLQHSPHIAVCLMVVPEHQDWHGSVEEYYTAKEQLFARQGTADVAVYYHDNPVSQRIAGAGQAQKVPYFHPPGAEVADGKIVIDGEDICRTDELKLLGQHNWQNACAAVTAVWYACLEVCGPADKPDIAAMREALTSFSGLEHRLELVRELEGVKYYDDSFGTTPETAIVALQAFEQPKVIILGGSDKGADYQALAQTVKTSNVRQALLIGNQAGRIHEALSQAGFQNAAPGGITMEEIVANARTTAQAGDIVLLSTACASFDMFKNYQDRGEQFKQAVQALVPLPNA